MNDGETLLYRASKADCDACALFLLVPALLRGGIAFWPSLAIGCLMTFLLYLATAWLLSRFGIQL